MEYGALPNDSDSNGQSDKGKSAPEQTRTVSHDLKLHAPKPSLPASSAKQQVLEVTKTDSDKAASFGLGNPSHGSGDSDRDPSRDRIRRPPSTALSTHSDHGERDDEHGIPEIGQRVPMNPDLGDVQAPSPGPENGKRHHQRKHSARSLPPGSYGLHGHGVTPQDQLEKAYYEKHPELHKKEQLNRLHERQNDYSMSRNELNRLVRDTRRRPASGNYSEFTDTPTEDVAFHASDEYAHRINTPQSSAQAEKGDSYFPSDDTGEKAAVAEHATPELPIHVDDAKHPEFYHYGDEEPQQTEGEYNAPILASDEIEAGPDARVQHPAIHPNDRHSSFDMDEAPTRPIIRPPSVHRTDSGTEFSPTPLENVKEYEPLFDEEVKKEQDRAAAAEGKHRHYFPSKDIWEDAPNSVHYTVEVSTPESEENIHRRKSSTHHEGRPITPAQAFAQYQEELAERESKRRSNNFLSLSEDQPTRPPTWIDHHPHLGVQKSTSPRRFPSKDVWEDVPESHMQETVLSESPPKDDRRPDVPARPTKKSSDILQRSSAPDRPNPRQNSGDDAATAKQPPPISDKPKPQIPVRPVKKPSGDSKDGEGVKPPKPPVPSRPVGSKIAALQAGFMSDLNKRLQLGPQGHKKEEASPEQEAPEEKETQPLSDARKGRARGPQRRAPKVAPAVVAPVASAHTLAVSEPQTFWSIDPEDGTVTMFEAKQPEPVAAAAPQTAESTEHPTIGGGSKSEKQAEDEPSEEEPKPTVPDLNISKPDTHTAETPADEPGASQEPEETLEPERVSESKDEPVVSEDKEEALMTEDIKPAEDKPTVPAAKTVVSPVEEPTKLEEESKGGEKQAEKDVEEATA